MADAGSPFETEPYEEGLKRALARIERGIGRPEDVTLMEGNAADLRGPPPQVIVYDPSVPSGRSTGTPLLITALCSDRTVWPRIHATFAAEGFDPLTPEPDEGRVCYASRTKALLIVEAHPGATRPADRTGLALLTSIVTGTQARTNDDRSDSMNPNNTAYEASEENRENREKDEDDEEE